MALTFSANHRAALMSTIGASVLAVLATVLMSSTILIVTGHNPLAAWAELVDRSLLRPSGREEVLVRTAPLLIAGSGVLIAVRAGVWNIGVDGQVLVGALATATVGSRLIALPTPVMWCVAALAGLGAGAAWSAIPGLLRARWGINDVVTSVMFTYVALSLTSWLVKGPLRDASLVTPQTRGIPVADRLARLGDSRVHLGVLVAVLIALVLWGVLQGTTKGYALRVVGANPTAARFAWLPVAAITFSAFVASGALAGLASANDVLSTKGTFQAEWNPHYGLAAYTLVFLARRDPRGLVPAAMFLALLSYGADVMPRAADIPPQFFDLFEGILLVVLVSSRHLTTWRFRVTPAVPR